MDIDTSSPCWSFFRKVNAQSSTLCITPPVGESLALTQRLSRLLLALAQFFRSRQTLSEVWTLYNAATAVVADLSLQTKQASGLVCGTLPSSQDTIHWRSEHLVADHQGRRGFKFALTLTLIMNGVLSTHYPQSQSLANFRNRFTNDCEAVPAKAEQLMPMGAGFMGMFFDHVWAVGARAAEAPAAWDMYGTETVNRQSTTFSKRLETTLESLL
jgi:hypothetical protein